MILRLYLGNSILIIFISVHADFAHKRNTHTSLTIVGWKTINELNAKLKTLHLWNIWNLNLGDLIGGLVWYQ